MKWPVPHRGCTLALRQGERVSMPLVRRSFSDRAQQIREQRVDASTKLPFADCDRVLRPGNLPGGGTGHPARGSAALRTDLMIDQELAVGRPVRFARGVHKALVRENDGLVSFGTDLAAALEAPVADELEDDA